MKKNSYTSRSRSDGIFWGFLFIVVAVIIILEAFHVTVPVIREISLWRLLAVLVMLFWIFKEVLLKRFTKIFLPLSILFLLLETPIAKLLGIQSENIVENWLLILCAILLEIGFSILFKKERDDDDEDEKEVEELENRGNTCLYIDCNKFRDKKIEHSIGECHVYFSNTDAYQGGGMIQLENNLGKIIIHVPETWVVEANIKNAVGSYTVRKNTDMNGKLLRIAGNNSFGTVEVTSK